MAAPDDPTVQGGFGRINPNDPMAFIMGGGGPMSLEEIKRRRAVAAAVATRSKGYPNTLGQGMTYLGEAIGNRMADERLSAAEKTYGAGRAADPLFRPPGAAGRVGEAGAVPGAIAEADPVSEQRDRIAALYTPGGVAQENPTVGAPPVASQVGSRLASLSPAGTLSDAPPIGMPRPSPLPPAQLGSMEENPPTPTSIAPMPTMLAQAGGGAPVVPGGAVAGSPARPPAGAPGANPTVFDKPTPSPEAPATPMAPFDPAVMKPLRPKPTPPPPDTSPTNEELRAMAIVRKYPGDEQAQLQAKYLADFGASRRQAIYARQVKEYDADLASWEREDAARQTYSREYPKLLREHTEATQKQAREQRMFELFPDGVDKAYGRAKESAEKVAALPAAQQAISGVRELLNSDRGMFTGSDANIRQGLAKWSQAFGAPYDPRVSNTETFKGLITPILAALRPAIVGSGAQSQPEFKLLQEAAAGNISLERRSIENILAAVEKLNAQAAVQHHKALVANSRGEPNVTATMFGTYELPMEKFVPDWQVDKLRKKVEDDPDNAADWIDKFDKAHFTRGLAQKLLRR